MTVLSVKLILALSCISAFCLGTGVADTCQQCTTEIDQMVIDVMSTLEREKERCGMKYPLNSCEDINDCDPSAPFGYYWINTTTGIGRMSCKTGSEFEGTTEDNPSTSCEAIYDCDPPAPSGYYWINSSSEVAKLVCFAGEGEAICVCLSVSGEDISTVTQASNCKFITSTPLPTPNPECEGTTEDNPSTSCEAIYECDPTAPSGYYWINSSRGVQKLLCSAGGYADCYDAMMQGATESGVYTIYPINANKSFDVYCDMETDGGGWTVLMKRQDGSVDFYRNWTDYKRAFGNLEGEHWLGLENMYLLTHQSSDSPQLRVDLADFEENTAFAKYAQFSVGDEDSDYILSVSGYQSASTAGDSLAYHNGQRFSTPDRDNDDAWEGFNCAVDHHAPWWHRDCYDSLLTGTGQYYTSGEPWVVQYGVIWYYWNHSLYSLRFADMKIRPGGV